MNIYITIPYKTSMEWYLIVIIIIVSLIMSWWIYDIANDFMHPNEFELVRDTL